MKLDTRLQTVRTQDSTLVVARIFGAQPERRVYASFERAVDWAKARTGSHDAIAVAGLTACAAHNPEQPDSCRWRVDPLIIHS